MLEMCENRRPGTFKNNCFSLKGVQISLCPPVPKRLAKCHQISPKIEPQSIQYCFRSLLETSGKNIQKQCQQVEEMGVQREPKSEPKSLKKGPQNTLSLLWVPLGAQGVPGITF
jgi:hypothetical protein